MIYNFDEIIDRKNTYSLKYDSALKRGKPEDILPFWVADMDFKVPVEVTEALNQAVSHGIFGYSESDEEYFTALHNWFANNFGWEIKEEWLVQTPGIVFAINTAIKAFTNPGDSILIQEPVYYPFKSSIKAHDRHVVINPLTYNDGHYTIDFEDFENKIITDNVKLFILCSPHNPVGRVWTKEELIRLGEICVKHNVLIIADEIHCDFTYKGFTHHVFSNLHPDFESITITCTAPSKTFNLAGLQLSNIFIPNQNLRTSFELELSKTGYDESSILGIIACKAAYTYGQEWLKQLTSYLSDNVDFIREFVDTNLEGVKLIEPEGTYLVWLDFSEYMSKHNLSAKELDHLIVHKAKLWLDDGKMFGESGAGFQRINVACPRALLEKALQQLASIM